MTLVWPHQGMYISVKTVSITHNIADFAKKNPQNYPILTAYE